jgi:hypothetical protein
MRAHATRGANEKTGHPPFGSPPGPSYPTTNAGSGPAPPTSDSDATGERVAPPSRRLRYCSL